MALKRINHQQFIPFRTTLETRTQAANPNATATWTAQGTNRPASTASARVPATVPVASEPTASFAVSHQCALAPETWPVIRSSAADLSRPVSVKPTVNCIRSDGWVAEDLCEPNPCGANAKCQPGFDRTNKERPVCTCLPGYTGDPLRGCVRGECTDDSGCADSQACIDYRLTPATNFTTRCLIIVVVGAKILAWDNAGWTPTATQEDTSQCAPAHQATTVTLWSNVISTRAWDTANKLNRNNRLIYFFKLCK